MNFYDGIPSWLLEASNGTVWPLLSIVCIGLLAYIIEHWWHVRGNWEGISAARPLCIVYEERKAAIAMLVGIFGINLKTFTIWYPRHLMNDGINPATVLSAAWMQASLIISTLLIMIGFTCWLRVTVPLPLSEIYFRAFGVNWMVGRTWWFIAGLACATFGLLNAIY